MADLSFRVQQVIKNEIDVTQAQLSRNGITLLTGSPASSIPHVKVEGVARRVPAPADAFIIATGTSRRVGRTCRSNGRTIVRANS
jgi:NAD(P) transhydrogenase